MGGRGWGWGVTARSQRWVHALSRPPHYPPGPPCAQPPTSWRTAGTAGTTAHSRCSRHRQAAAGTQQARQAQQACGIRDRDEHAAGAAGAAGTCSKMTPGVWKEARKATWRLRMRIASLTNRLGKPSANRLRRSETKQNEHMRAQQLSTAGWGTLRQTAYNEGTMRATKGWASRRQAACRGMKPTNWCLCGVWGCGGVGGGVCVGWGGVGVGGRRRDRGWQRRRSKRSRLRQRCFPAASSVAARPEPPSGAAGLSLDSSNSLRCHQPL